MTTKLALLFSLCLAMGALMLACGGGDSANTSGTTTASGDKIGVAECDDFLAKYESCVTGKVPSAAQASFKAGMEQWRKSWKELAANPQTKATLTQVCKTQLDAAKTSLSSYGCTW
jgi:hypothetical protein